MPQDPADLKKDIYLCRGCNEYQSSTDFALKTNASSVGFCRRCMDLDNEARRREDFSLYKNILRCLRESEAEYSPEAKITYLLQVTIHSLFISSILKELCQFSQNLPFSSTCDTLN